MNKKIEKNRNYFDYYIFICKCNLKYQYLKETNINQKMIISWN